MGVPWRPMVRFPAHTGPAGWARLGGAVRVLIVDDHPGFRSSARRLLEADGLAVVGEAADGEAALAAAAALDPDVVLLDVQLPVLDGPDVLRRLRADPRTASLPVVFLTGSSPDHDVELLALGARGVLHKPFDPGTVAAELAALL